MTAESGTAPVTDAEDRQPSGMRWLAVCVVLQMGCSNAGDRIGLEGILGLLAKREAAIGGATAVATQAEAKVSDGAGVGSGASATAVAAVTSGEERKDGKDLSDSAAYLAEELFDHIGDDLSADAIGAKDRTGSPVDFVEMLRKFQGVIDKLGERDECSTVLVIIEHAVFIMKEFLNMSTALKKMGSMLGEADPSQIGKCIAAQGQRFNLGTYSFRLPPLFNKS